MGGVVRPEDGKQLPTVRIVRVVIVGVLNLSGVWESGMTGLMDAGGAWKEAWLGHPSNWGEEEEGLASWRP